MAGSTTVPTLGAMIKGRFAREFFGAPTLLSKALANELRAIADRIERMGENVNSNGVPAPLQVDAHVQTIIETVAAEWRIEAWGMRVKDRSQRIATARQVAMYLARKLTPLSYPDLGDIFKRDHATVIHSVRRIEGRMQVEPQFAKSMERLIDKLGDFGALEMAERLLAEVTSPV